MPDEVFDPEGIDDDEQDALTQMASLMQEGVQIDRELASIRKTRFELSERERQLTLRSSEIRLAHTEAMQSYERRKVINNDHKARAVRTEKLKKLERFASTGTIEKED